MTALGHIIDRMIAAGMSPGEAGAVAAEIYAAGVASASTRSAGAERTRRWRENQASQSDGKRHQTSRCDSGSEASPNVTKRHEPSQCDDNAVSPIDTNIKKGKRQNSERPSRGTRIAPDWSPSNADKLLAKQEGFSDAEIDRQALRFRDYWTARAGSGGVKLDWPATWRNWVRTSAESLGKTPRNPTGSPVADGSFLAKGDSEEMEAWDAYGRKTRGKSFPRNRDGDWRFPSRWPPGYVPQTMKAAEPPPAPILRTMQ